MKKVPEDKKNNAAKRVEQLKIEVSILRGAYFQLEKAISERQKAERELQKSEERLSFLISSGPAVIYVSKAYGDYAATFISTNVKKQMGYKTEDFTSDPKFWVDHIHPDDRQRVLKELPAIFKKGHHAHEYRFRHKDGSYRWMYDESRLIKDENDKPKEIIGYWADITERKKAERDLGERMKELRLIYETSKVMEGNDDLSEALSEVVEAVPPAYQFPEITCARIIFNGKEYKTENFKKTKWGQFAKIKLKDRKPGVIEAFYLQEKPFLVEEKQMLNEVAAQISNITERKRATKELRKEKEGVERKVVERTKELRETQKRELAMKDEFVFIATHDLSAPVTAVIGYLDFIKASKEKFSEDTQKSFKAIEESAGRLGQLVEDLLQVARSESGTIKVEVSPVNIVELVETSIRQISLLSKEKNIRIKSELDQNNKNVLADDEKLSEVMENLLSNAVKFNHDGGRVDVKSVRVDNKLQVSVADTGYGISKAQQGKVFQKFFRARGKETKKVPGTGLGLFVVWMLIEKMKGDITFTSEEGKGTTFTFALPVASKSS